MEMKLNDNLDWWVAVAYVRMPPADQEKLIHDKYRVSVDDELFVLYSGRDPSAFFEKIGAPDKDLESIAEQSKQPVGPSSIRLYATFLPGSYEGVIRENAGNLIHTTNCDTPQEAYVAATSALQAYLLMRHFASSDQDFEEEQDQDSEPEAEAQPDHYTKVIGSLSDHLIDHYIAPLVRAYHHEEEDLMDRIKQDLYDFAEGAPFEQDIYEISDQIMIGRDLSRSLVLAYLAKVDAVHGENYEKAARLRDKIHQIKGGQDLRNAA